MTALLMSLHVASNAEILSTTFVLAFKRLFASVRISVDLQRTRTRECFLAGWTLVAISALGITWRASDWIGMVVVLVGCCCHLRIDWR